MAVERAVPVCYNCRIGKHPCCAIKDGRGVACECPACYPSGNPLTAKIEYVSIGGVRRCPNCNYPLDKPMTGVSKSEPEAS